MSQEYNDTLKRSRRARSQRNRPVLVTSSDENTTDEQAIQETTPVEEIEETPTAEPEPAPPARGRIGNRLPNFFSTVGKSEKADEQKETDVVQARLARATRGKASTATGKTPAVSEEAKETQTQTSKSETRAAPAAGSRARPTQQGAFKTRYILGIAIYLFAANFIGTGITLVLRQMHADVVLTQFTLFGGKVIVSSSTLLFLALLIIILVLLARFDLIPRSLAPSRPQTGASKSGETAPKQPPSPIRQGVKGEDDDLYQEYRLSQRRTKKR
jgi:hypothetical protein